MKSKFFYKVILSYKGTSYSGWQFQTLNPNTIQAEVEKVLAEIVNHQEFQLMAASRTDTGVHAKGQVLKIVLPKEVSPHHLTQGMNSKLPNDIRVIKADFISSDFNVNQDVLSKEYHYYFTQNCHANATLADTVNYINEKLDISLMISACELLKGRGDFTHFCSKGSREVTTVRDIKLCSIEKTSFDPIESEIYYLKIVASGFLKYMVRYIMGALIQIGTHKLSLDEFKLALENKPHEFQKKKAAAHGLHLVDITYR